MFCTFLCSEEGNDYDGDHVSDYQDNCPSDFNPGQADTEGDGIGDICDNCPDYDNPDQEDWDTDGVGNVCDNCWRSINPDQFDPNQDCPPLPYNSDPMCGVCEEGYCEPDFNCDGNVDATDVMHFLADFGRNPFHYPCSNDNQCNGDFDCDGSVAANDVTVFLVDFGRGQFNDPCPPCVAGDWCVY